MSLHIAPTDHLIIAIDGYSSCGKSTLAKELAKALGILYVDSGAMYRAITLFCIRHGIHPDRRQDVIKALNGIQLDLQPDNVLQVFLNGENVSEAIRTPEVSEWVSEISVIPEVRKKLVAQQRTFGEHKSLVMDGRDIGTVVFPSAQFKFFITADPEIRAQRRLLELASKGIQSDLPTVLKNLQHRDLIDSTREDSPLRQADDAIVIDNSLLDRRQQLEKVLEIIRSKKEGAS
ncbi:MAG: (d)CMP kinase [Saprospiraceae bacterium]|nr:(d)CMP kinase [Saprospiraceae bacterium]